MISDSTKVSAAVHSKAVKTLAQLSRGVVSLHCVVVEETVPSNPLHGTSLLTKMMCRLMTCLMYLLYSS